MKRKMVWSIIVLFGYQGVLTLYHLAQGPIDAKLALQSMDNSDAGWGVANSLGHALGWVVVGVLLAAIWLPVVFKTKKGKK